MNISEWYRQPFSIPAIGRSDHNAVLMLSYFVDPRPLPRTNDTVMYKLDRSGKAFIQQAVQRINWSPLYCLQNPDDMVTLFNSTVNQLTDQFMVPNVTRQHSRDKPWITEHFRYLIRRRQFAWRNKLMDECRHYRNRVRRAAWRLRRKYYENKLHSLRQSGSHQWWQSVKGLLGQSSNTRSQQLFALANRLTDGDVSRLADNINNFFHSISADLPVFNHNCVAQILQDIDAFPEDLVIEPCSVEYKLANISVYKSPGPDQIPNWFCGTFRYTWRNQCVVFSAHPLGREFFHSCGSRLMSSPFQRSNRQAVLNLIYAQFL